MQRPSVMLKNLSNKMPLIEEKDRLRASPVVAQ
jgi:hypothetical protein